MSLGSIKEAYNVFQQHDFSRSFQLRFLDIQVRGSRDNPVGRELIEQNGRYYITTMVVPGRTVQNIDVPYQGFQFKLPGQVAYDSPNPWTLNFRTAGDYLVRNALERLSFETANDETTCGAFNLPCKDTMITIGVLSPKCEIIRAYDLHGFYLQNISEISYNQENMEGTTFAAAFHYQYWRPSTRFRGGDLITAGTDLANTFETYSQLIENADQTCGVSVPNSL
jgi:hypothetical protein